MTDQCTPAGAVPPQIASKVRHVLVGPQAAGNVGASARAMKNLGFGNLVLVQPLCDPADSEARRFAVDARDVLERCRIAQDLDDALDGAQWVVGWSARTGRQRKPHWVAPDFRKTFSAALNGHDQVAMVFGCEQSGLSDRALDACTHVVALPASPTYSSFNLAQAVLLASYELLQAIPTERSPAQTAAAEAGGAEAPAPHEEREAMFAHLDRALRRIGFLHATTEEPIMRRLRRMVGRAGATSREVRVLRGMARQIEWAADQIKR